MLKKYFVFVALSSFVFGSFSCEEKIDDFQTNNCKRLSPFVSTVGIDSKRSAFSTSDQRTMGLTLVELAASPEISNRVYQDSTWKMAGWLGPIQIDEQGNVFVAPIPVINLINNKPEDQNILYMVDGRSGKMQKFIDLNEKRDVKISGNPYGLLGLAYNCESRTMYASSVLGSSLNEEKGKIYAIDIATRTIIDELSGSDAIGMGISYMSGQRRLYYGSPRNSNIYSVRLTADGKFTGKPLSEFSLQDKGPRGDDKVRRIKFDDKGIMQVYGVEFNFNLTAPTEKQEQLYQLAWNEDLKKWEFQQP